MEAAGASAPSSGGAGRPVRLTLGLMGAWLAAVVVARLLLAGGVGWALFALALPVLLLALGRPLGLARAVLLVAVFTAAVLAMRGLLATPRVGWAIAFLVPVVALSAVLAGRVAAGLLRARRE